MSTITTRATKGSALTWSEADANFDNLNTDKYQSGDSPVFGARMRVNSSLKSWDTVTYTTTVDFGSSGVACTSTSVNWLQNCYITGGNYIYVNSGSASVISQGGSQIIFYAADSGTAGNTVVMNLLGYLDGYQNLWYNHTGRIEFPATQNASTNANTLDDYEEGTWTPVDGSGAGLSFTFVSASYIKIGRQVQVCMRLVYPATASGAAAVIGGLPFTVGSAAAGFPGTGIAYPTDTAKTNMGIALSNTTTVGLYKPNAPSTNANMTGDQLILSITYLASS